MIKLKNLLKEIHIEEGVNDPGILKAVFLAGGPGSGKSRVAQELFGTSFGFTVNGLKNVNSDRFFEFLLKKRGISKDLSKLTPAEFKKVTMDKDSPRQIAKRSFKQAEELYVAGRLGLLIDGTGDSPEKIQSHRRALEEIGYDTYMVFVDTPLEKALERNNSRERTLPTDLVTNSWNESQKAKEVYKKTFGPTFVEIVNDKDAKPGQPLNIDPQAQKLVNKFISEPVKNPNGKRWIEQSRLNEQEEQSYKIFCDMDGVLADFVDQWKNYHKQDPTVHKKKIGKQEFDVFLDGAPLEFWTDMKFMPNAKGGKALWDKIKKYDTKILSSPAESEASKKGKQVWLKSKGINVPLILKKSFRKQEYAAPNHILIDDYKRNIDQWNAAGGIGILHKDNATTFAELKKYGIV